MKSGLTSISFPDSLTTIGDNTFSNCKKLTSVTIPGSVTLVGYEAFSDCTGLDSITFTGEKVPNFNGYAFKNVIADAYYPFFKSVGTQENYSKVHLKEWT